MKLRACPFCRSWNATVERPAPHLSVILCNNCGAVGPCMHDGPQGGKLAAQRWNTRAVVLDELPDGIQKLIARVPLKGLAVIGTNADGHVGMSFAEFKDFMQKEIDPTFGSWLREEE